MELNQLKYFKCVAETQNFTKAAALLHISQPSLSKSIFKLESELEVKLFERNKRYVRLTDYGEALLKHTKKITEEERDARLELLEISKAIKGDIKIASCASFSSPSKLYQYTKDFFISHPDLKLHQYLLDNKQIEDSLLKRTVNFAYSFSLPEHSEIQAQKLLSLRLGIVVSEKHPLAQKDSVHLWDLRNENFLTNNTSPDERDTAYLLCRQAGFQPHIIFEGDAAEIIGECVEKGIGVAFISEDRHNWKANIPQNSSNSKVHFLKLSDDFCKRTIYLYTLKNAYMPIASQKFIDGLIAYLS